ncbi:LacI family DNA-binding transcriptional regulator [Lentilactobacillus raoultii]|uniref:LacI family DNA-binding transcriptional regulator n=1 Tax=Lentilactobacillus raoultii TaxID=1987503 RepID=A0ABW3PP23_9LACO|nr:LacI family DNA-binding transcriptional regulator [Lentilactobacillus raoultii]
MPTIRDVSKAAKVSPGTVSRALNPTKQGSVSKETRLRIQKLARKMGYQTPAKRNGRKMAKPSQKFLRFALITTHTLEEEAKDEYWRLVRLGLYKEAEKKNIMIDSVINMHDGLDPQRIRPYDAVLIIGTPSIDSVKQLKLANSNIVIVDGGSNFNSLVDTVGTNFMEVTKEVLNALSANTKKEIACISGARIELQLDGRSREEMEDPRVTAYKEWISSHHKKQLFEQVNWSNTAAMRATDQLIEREGNQLGAIVVTSDSLLVIGVMKSLAKHHLTPGKDIFLVSFDDADFAPLLTPSLSTVWLPKTELGAAAILHAKSLSENNESNWTTRITLPSKIKYRDTFNPH